MLRIAFVTPEFITESKTFDGGLSNYLFRVSIGLMELSHIPLIIVSSDCNEIIYYQNIEVHRVMVKQPDISTSLNWLHQSFVLNKYLEKIGEQQSVDLVQYSSYTGIGFYRLKNLPVVTRLSSYNPLLSKYYNSSDNKDNSNRNFIEMEAIRNSDGVFGPSKIIAYEISKNEKLDIKVIESPFVTETTNHDFSLSDQLAEKKYLLFFGTIGLLKGVKTIAEILNELLSKHKDLFFVFIGKDAGFNNGKMIDYVYDQAGVYKNRVYYFDRMPHEQLYPFIKNSFAVVLPSRIDNFPNTCIEAMAHGKIVIGTKNTGFDQLIEDGINGILCDRDNPEELLNSIEKVLSITENERDYLQLNASKRTDLLRADNVVNELVGFYLEIIAKYRSSTTNYHLTDEVRDTFLWENILGAGDLIADQKKTIRLQVEAINSIYNSYIFKTMRFMLKPIYFFRSLIK